MALAKSGGSTPSERLLAKLCEQTFLGFWSYANTFRNQGGPKELCDLLVVCGKHIVLFSDKSCEFPDTGNLKLDWSRWFRKAVSESARQISGAERWLKQYPDRVFLDSSCTTPLPLALNHAADCRFHRVVVALGAQERCRGFRGGSGSLILAPAIVGKAHFDLQHHEVQPFAVGSIAPEAGHFHVLDDFTLPLLLKELDTIADFVSYLEFKEALFSSNKVGTIAGEENLLAFFIGEYVQTGDWRSLLGKAKDGAELHFRDGPWELYTKTAWYRDARQAMQPSYVWDHIIQQFSGHAFGGTLAQGSVETVAANEEIFRCIAQEPRWARAFLAATMKERWANPTNDKVDYRIVASPSAPDTLYVFAFAPQTIEPSAAYRAARQENLQGYCFLVASKNRSYRRIIGIASEAGEERYRTFDAVLLEGEQWSSQMESLAREIEQDLAVSGEGPIHRYSDRAANSAVTHRASKPREKNRRTDGKIGRNDLCPCGSGKKFKRCCLRGTR